MTENAVTTQETATADTAAAQDSAIAPDTPLTPAPAPHSTELSDGAWLLMNGTTHSSRATLVTSARTVTRTTLAWRAASPAA